MSQLKRAAEHLYRDVHTGTYYFIMRSGGKQRKESLGTRDRTLASQKVQDKLREAGAAPPPDAADLTWRAVADVYRNVVLPSRRLKPKSIVDRLGNLQALEKAWPGLTDARVRDITEEQCQRWMGMRSPKISPQRLNNELDTLKQVLDLAIKKRAVSRNPAAEIKRVKIPKRKPVIPTKKEVASVIDCLRARRLHEAADYLELLAYSGLRLEEAFHLRWSDIDWNKKQITVRGAQDGTAGDDPKNLEQRVLPLFGPLAELLERMMATNNQPADARVFSQHGCRRSLKTACHQLGIKPFTHHQLRKFFTANRIEEGIDFQTIATWLGHRDGGILVAKTYSHLRDEHGSRMAALVTFSLRNGAAPKATRRQS